MNRRKFLHAASALPLLSQPAVARPNVLIVLTDDQGYGDFSCHGNPVLQTPNMDKLHAESVRFTDFHAAPMCTPTRGQLMSGVDALKNRASSVTAGRAVLRRDLPTMADIFRDSGYATGLFGKWHLGDNYPYRPMDRGFQTAKYHLGWGFTAAPEFDNDYFNGRYQDNGVEKRFPGYCTDFWFDEAMKWMGQQSGQKKPFFCYLPTNTPHAPNWVDRKYSDPYNKPGLPKEFFGMIANLDENLGRLDGFLKSAGLRDNTIVVFMTDNGATQGRFVYNAGMREFKTKIYEGGHRVPCFVRWPKGQFRAPGDVATPTQVQDILPTLIDLCSLQRPANARFDGRSLTPLLRNPDGQLEDRMMVVQYGQVPKKWESTVIWKQYRLVWGKELYDIREDPGQKTDISGALPEVVGKMRAHYEQWWAPIEPLLDDFQPIVVGHPAEEPTMLTSSDWQNVYADNNGHVSRAEGGPRGAPWSIEAHRTADYRIELSRWPFHQKLPLTAGREPEKLTAGSLPPGKALPIAGAKLRAGNQEYQAKPAKDGRTVEFRVPLEAGVKINLHAWFVDAAGADLAGAFYARVTRIESAGAVRNAAQ